MNTFALFTLEFGKALLVPSNLLIVALAIGVVLLWFHSKAGQWVTTIVAIMWLIVAVSPVSSWVAKPLETRFPQPAVA